MELCLKIEDKKINFESFKQEMTENLYIAHMWNIVHMDLKPSNIMFSPKKQRYVLIDFGLSNIIHETVGFKSLISFSGNLQYCSQEMVELFQENQKKFIDIYYNDLVCL